MMTNNVLELVNRLRRYKCVLVPVSIAEVVARAARRAGLHPCGGAISPDNRSKWLYLD